MAGCDNMTWGGFQWSLESSARDSTSEGDPEGEAPPVIARAEGPILYLVERDPEGTTGTGSLIPLAIVSGDSLIHIVDEEGLPGFPVDFPGERLAAGDAFTLFSEGTRVGTFRSDGEVGMDASHCLARPRVNGIVELVPGAASATTFLALRSDATRDIRHGVHRRMESNYDQRVATLDLALELLPRLSARRPLSILDARRDLRIMDLDGNGAGTIATTFMHLDNMEVGRPTSEDAWALFFIAEAQGATYSPQYIWFRDAEDGKGAPRLVSHLDWNRDGTSGIILEIRGTDSRWFAAAERRGGTWQTTYEDPCGQAASTGSAGALD